MQPKKLLMISTDRKIFEEGSAVRARQIEYAKNWEEVHIVVFSKQNFQFPISNIKSNDKFQIPNEITISANCWAYSTRSRSKFVYPFDAISLGRFIIKKRGITEITCQDASLTAMAGISLKKQFHIPLEIQIHEDLGSPNFGYTISNKIRKTLALSYLPKADKIRVVSNKIKDYLTGPLGISAEKITVKPIAVDVEKIRSSPIQAGADLHKKYPQFEKIVLMAARFEKEKNVELAIKAWNEVIKMMPKAGLVIVGEGREEKQLKKLAERFGLFGGGIKSGANMADSVIFESWADYDTLVSYYKTADLFLNTSLFEGYGMVLVEAKAAGCIIVSTDVGVAREIGANIVDWDEKEVAVGIVKSLGEN